MVIKTPLHQATAFSRHFLTGIAFYALSSAVSFADALKPQACLTLYGACKYEADFTHFDYVNADAPKGGAVKLSDNDAFDSLNPFILKGVKAPAIMGMFESLMTQSSDEPLSMYPLIAESVTLDPQNHYAEFTLNKKAHWSDGTPITADDVVFSFSELKDKGDPTFKILYDEITACEKTGDRRVKFTFKNPQNKQLPMFAAQMPILSKAYYTSHDFEKTTLDAPLGSGPYKVSAVDAGRSITYALDTNYWGKDLPVNRGRYNFATMRYDVYRDENVALEALKGGEYDFRREYIARNWATAYDTPAIKEGKLIKKEIPDETPQGMQAFIFNTGQAKFADSRVRQAIAMALDFEWLNKTIFYGAYVRNASFFENTDYAATGIPQGKELELLKPYAKDLPPELFTQPFKNPVSDGSGNNRDNLLKAQKLLEDAGWKIKDGKCINAKGEPLTIEFLLHQSTMERVIGPMRESLKRLGIEASIRLVDPAQYQKRTDAHDFDVVSIWINRNLFFPGNEQAAIWQSSQADIKGSNNLGSVKNPAVDAMLDALLKAHDQDDLIAAGRALDRILLWEQYVIPNWHSGYYRVAYWDKFDMPKIKPKYDMGFDTWWIKK